MYENEVNLLTSEEREKEKDRKKKKVKYITGFSPSIYHIFIEKIKEIRKGRIQI